ncbi:MAG: ribosomal RNA small subunit methyltransferase A [Candidatus Omnitrophica bacterium]|nr:ribosomal RNA small subunit methyltransferase A [Candidatus Omnitrophota bacterium]
MIKDANNLSSSRQDLWESLYARKGLKKFMEGEGFFTSRALGQNFLINEKVMNSILNSCHFPAEGTAIEIGPGIGHLTWLLLHRGLKVVAVEKDRLFAERLPEWRRRWGFDETQLTIVHRDALDVDFAALAGNLGVRHVIGNLPYNVSVPILFHLAYSDYRFESICVMVQKEVGERIMASERDKQYGRLSIVLKYLFHASKIMTIRPGAFFPQPKVDSVFMKFVPNPQADVEFAWQFLERAAHIGFLHRRKKMRKNLQGCLVQKRVLSDLLPEIEKNFDLDQRAEDWPIEEWIRFASFIRSCPPAES